MTKEFRQNQVTAVILAGGQGTRLGKQDKGLLPWHGKPLIEHVCERISGQVGTLLISCNQNSGQYSNYSDVVFSDLREENCGPLAGLEAARTHIETGIVLVVSCDTPLLPDKLVERLIQPIINGAEDAPTVCYAQHRERQHYLCAAIASSVLDSITPYLDQRRRSVRGWYESLNAQPVNFPDHADAFKNFNDWRDFDSDLPGQNQP
jgi:molybdenum cofactor guanylyltransferase